jgi:N utilization substance protein B
VISGRHTAREAALLILFAIDANKISSPDEPIRTFHDNMRDDPEVLFAVFGEEEDLPFDEKLVARAQRVLGEQEGGHWSFVDALVRGSMDHQRSIDELIGKSSLNWKVARMNRVDRNILRLAAYELAFEPEVPGRAVLNEAIELAKRYGTEDSGKFVNGILDRIAQDLGRV